MPLKKGKKSNSNNWQVCRCEISFIGSSWPMFIHSANYNSLEQMPFGDPGIITPHDHMIMIWVFGNQFTFAVICGHMISICNLPSWLPRKSIVKLNCEARKVKVTRIHPSVLMPLPAIHILTITVSPSYPCTCPHTSVHLTNLYCTFMKCSCNLMLLL